MGHWVITFFLFFRFNFKFPFSKVTSNLELLSMLLVRPNLDSVMSCYYASDRSISSGGTCTSSQLGIYDPMTTTSSSNFLMCLVCARFLCVYLLLLFTAFSPSFFPKIAFSNRWNCTDIDVTTFSPTSPPFSHCINKAWIRSWYLLTAHKDFCRNDVLVDAFHQIGA